MFVLGVEKEFILGLYPKDLLKDGNDLEENSKMGVSEKEESKCNPCDTFGAYSRQASKVEPVKKSGGGM